MTDRPRTAETVALEATRIDLCKAVAADVFGVRMAMIDQRDRRASVAEARQAAMWLLRHVTAASANAIGGAFNRDHSTAIHAVETVERRRHADPVFGEKIGRMVQALAVLQAKGRAA